MDNTLSSYRLRPFKNQDHEACLAVFDSNVPKYFAAEERQDYALFLEKLPGPYFVLENERGSVIACGGYATGRDDESIAVLCWGMVDRSLHRSGVGTKLLTERLRRISAEPQFSIIKIETSPHSRGFFERFGFTELGTIPDGFAPGLDLVRMELDLALASIRRACPALEIHSVEPIGSGQNNVLKLVNSELIFRFPKYKEGTTRLKREADLLSFIADRLPLDVPRPLLCCLDHETIYRPFISYRKLNGEPLQAERLQQIGDDAVRRRLAWQLTGFLRHLHSMNLDDHYKEERRSFDPYAEWADLYERIQTKLYSYLKPEARQWTDQHFGKFLHAKSVSPIAPALIHGDFGTSNLLYDPDEMRICGILDFDEAGIGDPAVDYAALRASYGESFFKLVLDVYPEVHQLMDRVIFYQGTFALQEALFGLENGDSEAFHAGIETVNAGG